MTQTAITPQAVRVVRVMFVIHKLLSLTIKFIQPATVGANPEYPFLVFINCADSITAQAVRIAGDGPIMAKWLSSAVNNVDATASP